MRVAKSRLVNLFVHLGCPKAEKWSNDVLEGRVAAICELFDLEMPIDDEYRKLFKKVYGEVKENGSVTIVDDAEEPVTVPVQRVDTSLRLHPDETPFEQERRKRGHKTASEPPPKKRGQRGDYGQYLSEWGTWNWMPGYEVDKFFLAGGSGTIAEISEVTHRKRVSVQRHLLLLLRFGLIIWGEGDVFRSATRAERIHFIDHGIKKTYRPMGVFVVRKPMITDSGSEEDV